jgi:hypothetical protein
VFLNSEKKTELHVARALESIFSSELHKPTHLQLSSLSGKWAVMVVDRSRPPAPNVSRQSWVRAESVYVLRACNPTLEMWE